MVQVVRGGTIYFVPESEALATDELVGPEAYGPQEEGFDWADGSAALAAPQRRTMHRWALTGPAIAIATAGCCATRVPRQGRMYACTHAVDRLVCLLLYSTRVGFVGRRP